VRASVPLQLVAAREALPAEDPVADERAFARVQAHVSTQQRGLPEGPPALGDVADVLLLPWVPRPGEEITESLRLEKTSKVTKSNRHPIATNHHPIATNHHPIATTPARPHPKLPHPHVF